MDAEKNRNNPQNPEDKVRAQGGERTQNDQQRADINDTNLHDVVKEEHGLAHGELKLHAQEFEETAGQTMAPTVDPPMNHDPEENTAPPQ